MTIWKIVLAMPLPGVAALGEAAAGVIYSGAYNVAATSRHGPIISRILEQTTKHAVVRWAAGLKARC